MKYQVLGLLGLVATAAIATLGAEAATDSATAHRVGLTRITETRIRMESASSMLCRSLTPEERRAIDRESPHVDNWAHLYANHVALDYRRQHPDGHDYPVGSVFLKEKYSSEENGSPRLATVMSKRATSGNVSDWEFSTLDLPAATRTVSRGGGKCAKCHADEKATGHISRVTETALLEFLASESKSFATTPPPGKR